MGCSWRGEINSVRQAKSSYGSVFRSARGKKGAKLVSSPSAPKNQPQLPRLQCHPPSWEGCHRGVGAVSGRLVRSPADHSVPWRISVWLGTHVISAGCTPHLPSRAPVPERMESRVWRGRSQVGAGVRGHDRDDPSLPQVRPAGLLVRDAAAFLCARRSGPPLSSSMAFKVGSKLAGLPGLASRRRVVENAAASAPGCGACVCLVERAEGGPAHGNKSTRKENRELS